MPANSRRPDGKLEVGARQEDDWVHMWVKDNGPGFRPRIRTGSLISLRACAATTSPAGLGSVWHFCRLAVLGHGGRIWVESEPGKGSVFHFTFPVATEQQLAGSG